MKARGLTHSGQEHQPFFELYVAVINRAFLDLDKGGKTAKEAETFLQDVLEERFCRVAGRRRRPQSRSLKLQPDSTYA